MCFPTVMLELIEVSLGWALHAKPPKRDASFSDARLNLQNRLYMQSQSHPILNIICLTMTSWLYQSQELR